MKTKFTSNPKVAGVIYSEITLSKILQDGEDRLRAMLEVLPQKLIEELLTNVRNRIIEQDTGCKQPGEITPEESQEIVDDFVYNGFLFGLGLPILVKSIYDQLEKAHAERKADDPPSERSV